MNGLNNRPEWLDDEQLKLVNAKILLGMEKVLIKVQKRMPAAHNKDAAIYRHVVDNMLHQQRKQIAKAYMEVMNARD